MKKIDDIKCFSVLMVFKKLNLMMKEIGRMYTSVIQLFMLTTVMWCERVFRTTRIKNK